MTNGELVQFIEMRREAIAAARDEALDRAKREYEQARAAVVSEYHAQIEALLDDAIERLEDDSQGEEPAAPQPDATESRVPRQKETCPDCGKEVQKTKDGFRAHNLPNGTRCKPQGNAGGEAVSSSPATSPAPLPLEPPPPANPHTAVDEQAASLFP
jgi:hypothetical protein